MNLNDPMLGMLATTVDDLEHTRKAAENRLRQLIRKGEDKDGEERGFGLDATHPSVIAQATILQATRCDSKVLTMPVWEPGMKEDKAGMGWKKPKKERGKMCCIEHEAITTLEKQLLKNHPLGPWVMDQKGLGLKVLARLLGSIGDPYWMVRHEKQGDKLVVIEDRPRTVSELWAYCGLDPRNGAARKRTKGELANWKGEAKMRCWNVVQPIIKCADSPYRKMYDELKESMQGAVYSEAYEGRMFQNKPIEVGQPLSKGHIEARVQRRLMKEILKDLWVESKRLHDLADAEILVAA